MAEPIRFVIPGRISGKGRPRFSARSGKVRTFTDAKTVATESLIRGCAAAVMRRREIVEGAVMLDIQIYQAVPQSWSAKKRSTAFYLTGRPDADNLAKVIADAVNGVVYRDDAQISDLSVKRRYASDGKERVEVTVYALTEPPWIQRRGLAKGSAAA